MDTKLLNRLKIWRNDQARREGVEMFRVLSNATLEALAAARPGTREAFLQIKGLKEAKWRKYGAMLLVMVADSAGDDTDTAASLGETNHRRVSNFRIRNAPDSRDQMTGNEPSAMTGASDARTQPTADGAFDEAWFQDVSAGTPQEQPENPDTDEPYTVSAFLDLLNDSFASLRVRIRGEVSSVDHRDRVVYFSLKDSTDDSTLSCLIFRSHYDMWGVAMERGQEVIVEGEPQIWKPTGRMSVKAVSVELVGEGALQKAYDDLKKKLESEGLFSSERKRPLPEYPERIALITSSRGAAIGDFTMNVGRYGYRIRLYDTSVEGARAVPEIMKALRYFDRHTDEYDVLVIVRGGGSLESLQAFNNERLVRAIADSKLPVLAGIGHEKDVSLAALTADVMVSTPTATARALRESWDRAVSDIDRIESQLLSTFEATLRNQRRVLETQTQTLSGHMRAIQTRCLNVEQSFLRSVERFRFAFAETKKSLARSQESLITQYTIYLRQTRERLDRCQSVLRTHDPSRLLKLGYSLVYKQGKLIRSVQDVAAGDTLELRLGDGIIETEAKK